MYYSPEGDHTLLNDLELDFRGLVDELEKFHIEYDIGCENIMKDHGCIADGKLVIGERSYSKVLLPASLRNLDIPTMLLIEEFLIEGGTVVSLGNPPEYIDGEENDLMSSWPDNYTDQWMSFKGNYDANLFSLLSNEEFEIISQSGADILHHRRIMSDGQLLFIVNSDKEESAKINFKMKGKNVVQLDLFNGNTVAFPFQEEGKAVNISAELPPVGSLLLYISNRNGEIKSVETMVWQGEKQEISLEPIAVKAISENVQTLDYCYLTMGDYENDFLYFYDASQAIFEEHGFAKNPWVSAVQFKQEIVERDTFSAGTGFVAEFPFMLDPEMADAALKMVVERPHLYSVYINNELVSPTEGEWWVDKSFMVFDITGKTISGKNLITLKADPMSIHCELEPVYLLGDFKLQTNVNGWKISSPTDLTTGSWKQQGYPFYSDAVDYSTSFNLQDINQAVKLKFGEWNGTVASVFLNGEKAGQIFAPPYELRLDNFLREGGNELSIRVFGSLKNALGPHHNVNVEGLVTPWSFKYAEKEQAAGDEYNLLDYGLMENVRIVVGK